MEMPELLGQVQSITSGQVEAIDPTRSVAPSAHRAKQPTRTIERDISCGSQSRMERDVNRSLRFRRQ
jgi:hypothetical protein